MTSHTTRTIAPIRMATSGQESQAGAWRTLNYPHGVFQTGPDIWFQKVDDIKIVKNRLHLDSNATGGIRKDVPRPAPEACVRAKAERLASLGATTVRELVEPGIDHFGIAMTDPEGNSRRSRRRGDCRPTSSLSS